MKSKTEKPMPIDDRELDAILLKARIPKCSAQYEREFPSKIIKRLLSAENQRRKGSG
jgi:hypothetical protein